jgi:hypothetical protein
LGHLTDAHFNQSKSAQLSSELEREQCLLSVSVVTTIIPKSLWQLASISILSIIGLTHHVTGAYYAFKSERNIYVLPVTHFESYIMYEYGFSLHNDDIYN